MDIFEFTNIIMAKSAKISKTQRANMSSVKEEIDFSLMNIPNGYTIQMTTLYDSLTDDAENRLDASTALVWIFFGIIAFFGVAGIFLLGKFMMSLIKKRNTLIEVFLRIEKNDIEDILSIIKAYRDRYQEGLKSNEPFLEFLVSRRSKMSILGEKHQKQKVKTYRRRLANMAGIDKWAYYTFFWIILWSGIFLTSFGLLKVITSQQDKKLIEQFNNLVEVNKKTVLLYTIPNMLTYHLITNGFGLVSYGPVGFVLDFLYEDAKSSETFLHHIYEATTNDTVKALLNGNICKQVQFSFINNVCPQLLSGVLTQGLIKTSAYIFGYIRRTKDLFDNSNRTFEMQRLILNDTGNLQVELAVATYLFAVFSRIEYGLEQGIIKTLTNMENQLLAFIIPTIIFVVIAGSIMWYAMSRNLDLALKTWKDLAKMIPYQAISNIKALQNCLLRYGEMHQGYQ